MVTKDKWSKSCLIWLQLNWMYSNWMWFTSSGVWKQAAEKHQLLWGGWGRSCFQLGLCLSGREVFMTLQLAVIWEICLDVLKCNFFLKVFVRVHSLRSKCIKVCLCVSVYVIGNKTMFSDNPWSQRLPQWRPDCSTRLFQPVLSIITNQFVKVLTK